ncbi:MAG TPA: GNAT family N-acetyltransferase [Candidatus Cybelea sp.]|nr:GNAT family N-acetyltransferase [Candidatus Cybelea sp.]
MIVRASVDDVRAIVRRRGMDETSQRLALHCAEAGTAWAARDESEVVGIALALDHDDERYLGDVFVEPSFRGQGLGRALLSAAFEEAGDRARTMLVEPSDLASLALAARYGLRLREPVLQLAGAIAHEEELAKMAAGDYRFEVAAIDAEAHGFGLRALDRQTRAIARDEDHAAFAREASGCAFFLRGEFVAYAYIWPDGRVGPLACASPAYLVQILAFALRMLTEEGASWCAALVPGSNLRVTRAALKSGLRITGALALASDSSDGDLSTYVGCHALQL